MSDILSDINDALTKTLYDFITVLREPTPLKITHVVRTDENGCIGGGLDSPDPHTLWECPMSQEAWVHRIHIMSPQYPPADPCMTGQMVCYGSTAHETIFFLPEWQNHQICPAERIQEGSKASPHLNSGEKMWLVGDQLPPHCTFIFQFQIVLVAGISGYTPLHLSPTRVTREEGYNGYQPGTTTLEP